MSIDGLSNLGPMRKHEGSMVCAPRSKDMVCAPRLKDFERLLLGGKLESIMSWRTAFKVNGPGTFVSAFLDHMW